MCGGCRASSLAHSAVAASTTARSAATEDYLKAVYALEERGLSPVTTTDLAHRLGVSVSSASGMVRKLGDLGLVSHRRYHDVGLTDSGRQVAMSVLRRHRIIELYLVEALGFQWDEVHDEAEVLEHAVSGRLLDRMAAVLGNPTRDPHGAPIPTTDGRLVEEPTTRLCALEPGMAGELVRVADAAPQLLRYLAEHHISLGDRVEAVERQPLGGPLLVRIGRPPNDSLHTFGGALAAAMEVVLER
jgi:DtxR family transcriptional regulator, Mn-dependent transcriptional regulator